jgi:hypothetical protein
MGITPGETKDFATYSQVPWIPLDRPLALP